MSNDISEKNLFMMCRKLNPNALSELPNEYHVRTLRRDELDLWKGMHFDDEQTAEKYYGFMTKFFNDVYGGKEDFFFSSVYLFAIKMILP